LLTACVFVAAAKRVTEASREYMDKFNWIVENLPFFPNDKIIFCNNKQLFRADVIIDDRIDNLKGDYATKILLTARHNKEITKEELDNIGAVRANNWAEILWFLGVEEN